MAFDRLEPIGGPGFDFRTGVIASAVANHGARYPKDWASPIDYMPFVDPKVEEPIFIDDPEKQSAMILKIVFSKES